MPFKIGNGLKLLGRLVNYPVGRKGLQAIRPGGLTPPKRRSSEDSARTDVTADLNDDNFIISTFDKFGGDRSVAERIRKDYAKQSIRGSVFVSGENEISGFRRLVILGPVLSLTNECRIFSVLDNGLLVSGNMNVENYDGDFSASDIIEYFTSKGRISSDFDFDINFRRPEREELYQKFIANQLIGGSLHKEHMTDGNIRATREISNIVRCGIAESLKDARLALMSSADPQIMKIIELTGMATFRYGEFLSGVLKHDTRALGFDSIGENFKSNICETSALRRQQAVVQYPLMAEEFFTSKSARKDIDEGISMRQIMQTRFGIPAHGVRNLHGLTRRKCNMSHDQLTAGYAMKVASIPRDFMPKNEEEFDIFNKLISIRATHYRHVSDIVLDLARSGNPWHVAKKVADVNSNDIHDYCQYIVRKLIDPIRIRRGGCKENTQLGLNLYQDEFIDQIPLKDLINGSKIWHRNVIRHNIKINKLKTNTEWPHLLGLVNLSEDVVARELCSSTDLEKQGEKEKHCVSGYADTILKSDRKKFTLIYSIERRCEIIGTIQLVMSRLKFGDFEDDHPEDCGLYKVDIAQIRGKRNSAVCKSAEMAGEILAIRLKKISAGQINEYLEKLISSKSHMDMKRSISPHILYAGYNIWDDQHLRDAWDELSSYLPRGMRRAGLEEMMKRFPKSDSPETVESIMLSDLRMIKDFTARAE